MWIKRTFKVIVFCIAFVVMFQYIYKVLSWKDTAGDYVSSMNSFYELEEDVVDVLFLGSSHCYCSVNNSLLWDEFGISSFSLAISGQDLASSYHCLVEALKTQTPEVVMVELYGASFDGYTVTGNLYRNTLPYKISENAYHAVNSMVKEGQEADFLLRWPIIHTRYAELQKEDFLDESPVYIGYQAEFETNGIAEIIPYEGEGVESLGENREHWIQEMIDLAEEAGINLCFFVAPYAALEQEQMCYKRAEKIAEERNVPFINMIEQKDELALNTNGDFIDWMHTNHYGAEKVTRYLGEYLKQNYELVNHHGDDRYRLWDEDLAARQHEWQNHQLKMTSDVKSYLDAAARLDDYTVIVATSGEYLYDGADLTENLQNVGIGNEFYDASHLWVFRDQEPVCVSGEEEVFFQMDLGQSELTVSSGQGKKSIAIDKVNYCISDNGINIVVYDNILGQVADAVGFWSAYEYAQTR